MEMELQWEYPALSASDYRLNHLLISLKTPAVTSLPEQQPLAIAFVLDKSWSMKGEKLISTIEAVSSFIHWMTRRDYVSIVAYSQDIQIIQPLEALSEKSSIARRLSTIQVGTSTNLSGGWLEGLRSLEEADLPPGTIRRVVLLTDGLATMGIEDSDELEKIALSYAEKGIYTTTIGIGSDFNEASLHAIAKSGGGNFYYIASPEQTSDIFFREFGFIGSIYAQATHLHLKNMSGLRFLEILGEFPMQENKQGLRIQIGDLRSDDEKQIVLTFEADPEASEPRLELELNYYPIGSNGTMQKISKETSFVLSAKMQTNKTVQQEILIAWTGKALIQAAELIDSDEESAVDILQNMKTRIENASLEKKVREGLTARIESMLSQVRGREKNGGKLLRMAGETIFHDRNEIIVLQGNHDKSEIFEYQTEGDLDLYNAPELRELVSARIREGYNYVILELSKTPYADSSAIGSLIQIANWLRRNGGMLVIANPGTTLEKLFQLTHLDNFIPMTESLTDARMLIESRQERT